MNHMATKESARYYYPPNYPHSKTSQYSAMPFNPYNLYGFQQNTSYYGPYNPKNRQTAGAVATGILTGIANAKSAVDTAANIIKQLNQTRSVILEINNNTDLTFRKQYEKHQEGGWALTPTGQIPPHHALVFGAQSPSWSITEGTVGQIIYAAPGVVISVWWSNPVFYPNNCDLQILGPDADKYWINKECGKGNVGAHMRYEIYPR
ncbi:hypothetical protein ACJ2A9_00030 [Anaerobacillus sp. MEB173]|uniref:hypothetical protein n=1 Tax=Anaerobacillus sp. MEB173 TaxID=3383345 RepID=UPI003F930758